MSQFVLTYAPNIWSKPTGVIWWDEDDGTVRSEFTDPQDRMLALDRVIGLSSRIQFELYSDRLASRVPVTAAWDTAEIRIPPGDYLKMMQRARPPAA